MRPFPALRLIAVLGLAAAGGSAPIWVAPAAQATPTELRVSAGKYERRNTLVPVSLPRLAGAAQQYELRDGVTVLPVQIDADGQGWFLLPSLAAGVEKVFSVAIGSIVRTPPARATATGSDVAVVLGDRPVLTYLGGPGRLPSPSVPAVFQRGGYIHPVRTLSGRSVTDDYPDDHYHQHGVMFAWTSAEFEGRKTDFWNMGDRKGRVEHVRSEDVRSGPVYAAWRAYHRYVDLTSGAPKPALDETWDTRVYALSAGQTFYMFDIAVRQRPSGPAPLVLPEYHYGGMAVRGAASFRGAPANEIVLTSEGKGRVEADNSRARWAHIAGRVDGALAGIAMLGHPDNLRAPEPMRVHPTDPYICFVPSRLGGWSITPDTPHAVRYRFVVSDGAADAALLDRIWRDFAEPPAVRVR